jgi:putative colanic acid biosynthesis acetyltransferase WcaF
MKLSQVKSPHPASSKVARALWGLTWIILFRPSPRIAYFWRRAILKAFGAQLGKAVRIDNSVRIFMPSNLVLGDYVAIGSYVDLYCVAPMKICSNTVVSQYSYLCAATHDYEDPLFPVLKRPVTIGSRAWICAGAFVGPGVSVGDDAVVGARAVVIHDVERGAIVAGNPARRVKMRKAYDAPNP